ncbi:MAG: hypothetical protein HWN65_19775 [Candidatus Helarchaeota archaeon]|nr:hypothetical protein [Candidatus Helarchaeota archaeon]
MYKTSNATIIEMLITKCPIDSTVITDRAITAHTSRITLNSSQAIPKLIQTLTCWYSVCCAALLHPAAIAHKVTPRDGPKTKSVSKGQLMRFAYHP